MSILKFGFPINKAVGGKICLPASKSESNRALMIQAYSSGLVRLHNLSEARDTQILEQLLQTDPAEYDALDAGTSFRFLTSFLAFLGKEKLLTGTARMQQRPIGILVEKLNEIGANVSYVNEEGFPPLKFRKGDFSRQKNEIEIEASQSSQFISSLMLLGPNLPNGLEILLKGEKLASLPYLTMTWQLMKRAGIKGSFEGRKISIPAQKYVSCELNIESDWSAVGYWLNLLVFSKAPGELEFNNLFADSLQGDARLISIFENLGLVFEVSGNGFLVRNTPGFTFPSLLEIDFSDIPDQGQTLMVTCAGLGIEARFSGLESLVIKETNRLKAMQSELGKFGISMDINELEGKCHMAGSQVLKLPTQRIETYEDHRMAMSIAPLAILFSGKLEIENPGVVAKSFPGYWDELAKLGFDLDWEER